MNQPHPAASCEECRFWQEVGEEDGVQLGVCRRSPPTYDGWPMTRPDDWCGEFASARVH